VLCALWIAMLFVFAYVDIFGFHRADVLDAALHAQVATTAFEVDQMFLTFTLIPILMVVLSLLLKPRVNRIINIVVSLLYLISIIVSCIGEKWAYCIFGSVIEVILLGAIARSAWTWPPPQMTSPCRRRPMDALPTCTTVNSGGSGHPSGPPAVGPWLLVDCHCRSVPHRR
jgi:uncharacterized membrane protein